MAQTEVELFEERYGNLNERQKEAVDTIYGPVMVIAGPGTGKTEVLSMRIANLLRSEAQVQPHEILCLTYTDEAANAMRRRLLQIIGTAAHRINIVTFHAFCNNVIQSNSEYFSMRSLQPITDLERTELLYEIMDELPVGHPLRKLSGNIYFDVNKLNRLFDMMKREHLRPGDLSTAIDDFLSDIPNREKYIYKRASKQFKKGDLKQDLIDDETKKMNDTRAAAYLYDAYTEKMKKMGRYDFNDMIIWVLDAFKNNPALLQNYQERHQFILVDEFQDTNGSQNELLTMLTGYWDDPNIFVVGDDDQGIYEFQGARIRNIVDFYQRYKENIKIVVLPHNYRSSQQILDKAAATIRNNKQRLINQLQELELNKDIIAASARFKDAADIVYPVINVFSNTLQEEMAVVHEIEQLKRREVPLQEVAILYAQHKQADNIIAMLERKGIAYSVKKPVNVLDLPLVQQVINILTYLNEEKQKTFNGEALLFEIIHAPYYGIASSDIAQIALYKQINRKEKTLEYWRFILGNALLIESLELKSAKAIIRFGNNMDSWLREQVSLPLPLLIEKIIYESGIINYLLHTQNYTWNIQVVHTFFEYVKEVCTRNPRMKVTELLRMFQRMDEEQIAIPVQRVIQNENGVHFYTAHGAKGNEFEYVFLIGCTKNYWENKRGGTNEYRLPDTITFTDDDAEKSSKEEVARRLFYVALTRARKYLQVSYATSDNAGKSTEASVFVDEISTAEERQFQKMDSEEMVAYMAEAMEPVSSVQIELTNNQYIERILQSFIMSYTALSKYLHCPLAFYYEHILKVPFQKSDPLAFGSAVHYALERMFKDMKENKDVFPDKDHVIGAFNSALYGEISCFTPVQFERRLEQGKNILGEYYDNYITTFPTNVDIEYKVARYMLEGIPVTGKIDKIEYNGDTCTVIDYKTGDPDKYASAATASPNEKEPMGGDYWRQMVFYKLLLERQQDSKFKVAIGRFDYIQKGGTTNKYRQFDVPMFAQDEELVMAQLKQAYTSIMNHEFDTGCGKEDCHWCNFARTYQLIRPAVDERIEIDDM